MDSPVARAGAPIVFDARFIHEGGVERYIAELVPALVTHGSQNRFRVYVPSQEYATHLGLPRPGWDAAVLRTQTYHPCEQWALCRRMRRDAPALFHAPNYWVVPVVRTARLVVTVHDVFVRMRPRFVSWKARVYARVMHALALQRANRVITVSEYTRQELLKFCPEVANKTIAVLSGIGRSFVPIQDRALLDDLRERYELPPAFLLYVGSTKPHKNLARFLRAYALLPEPLRVRYPFVLVAKQDPRHRDIQATIEASGLDRHVLWRHGPQVYVDLPGLYNLATALAFPSYLEYFGFPFMEAMACGIPTLAARAGSLPEVGGNASLYVDPTDEKDMAAGLGRLLEDPELRRELRQRGLARAGEFTWERTAARLHEIYDEVLGEEPNR